MHPLQHTYLELSEFELSKCPGGELKKICTVNYSVYRTEIKTCSLSLFSQYNEAARDVCRRRVITSTPPPALHRHGATVVYQFTGTQLLHIKCRSQEKWEASSVYLSGSGIIHNTASCHISTTGVQLYPIQSGETTFAGAAPELYAPHLTAITSPKETMALRELVETSALDTLAAGIQRHRSGIDLESLLSTRSTTSHHYARPDWHTPVIVTIGVMTLLHIAYQLILMCNRQLIERGELRQIQVTDLEMQPLQTLPSEQPAEPAKDPQPSVGFVKH